MKDTDFHTRLATAADGRSFRELGELTGTHPETVRRYMHGQAPSAEFLASFCRTLEISSDWLLNHRGPMRTAEATQHALDGASAIDLLGAFARRLEAMSDRMEKLEKFVENLEVLVQVRSNDQPRPKLAEAIGDEDDDAEITVPSRVAKAITRD